MWTRTGEHALRVRCMKLDDLLKAPGEHLHRELFIPQDSRIEWRRNNKLLGYERENATMTIRSYLQQFG